MEEEVQVLSNAYIKGDDKGYKANEKYLFNKLASKMKLQTYDIISPINSLDEKETLVVKSPCKIIDIKSDHNKLSVEILTSVENDPDIIHAEKSDDAETLGTEEEENKTDQNIEMPKSDSQSHTSVLDIANVSLKCDPKEEIIDKISVETHKSGTDIECNIEEDLKSLMKIIVQQRLKPSGPIDKGSKAKEQCLECDFSSKYKQKIKDHELSVHNGEVRFRCSQCSHKTFYEHDMIKHMEEMHIGEDLIILGIGCELCNKSVEHTNCDLNEEEDVPGISRDFKCKECQYTCKARRQLHHHVKIKHRIVKYGCGRCTFRDFDKTAILLHHENDHKEEEARIVGIGCKLCKNGEKHTLCSFGKPGGFVRWDSQMKKHLKCTQCLFETGLSAYLKNHIKLVHADHTNTTKILDCSQCEFQTVSGTSLKNHVQALHEKKTRFYCSMCDYKAFYSHYIKQHIKSHHKSEEEEAKVLTCLSYQSVAKNLLKTDTPEIKDYIQFEPKYLNCTSCQFTTNSVSSLTFHTRSQHVNDGWYFCNMCEQKSYSKKKVVMHIQLKHRDDVGAKAKRIGCLKCQSCSDHEECEFNVKLHTPRINVRNRRTMNCKEIDCDYNSVKPQYIATHQRLRHSVEAIPKEDIVKCTLCEFENNRKAVLERHIKATHNKELRFACSMCIKKSFYRQDIRKHIDIHHKNSLARILVLGCTQCLDCNPHIKCDSIWEIKEHQQSLSTSDARDQNLDLPMLNCDRCAYTTQKRRLMGNHQKEVHGIFFEDQNQDIARFKCVQCTYTTTNVQTLRRHEESVHTKIRNYFCSICDYKSYEKKHAISHTKTAHKEMKVRILFKNLLNKIEEYCEIFKCEQCNDAFTRIGRLTRHLKSYHEEIKQYSCSLCDFKSYEKYPVESHLANTHPDATILTLNILNTNFSSDSIDMENDKSENLQPRKLRKFNSTKRRSPGYKCKLCNITKFTHKALIVHMKTDHGNAKIFECNSCPYKCNWLPNLKTHEQAKHSGTKYECELCGWKTAWKPPFFEHKRAVHGIFQKNSKYREDLEASHDLCDLCGFSANSKRSMRLHKSSGCEMKNNPISNRYKQYKKLLQRQGDLTALAQPKAASPDALRRYQICKECGFKARSLFHLNTHKHETHIIGEIICSVCEFKCKNKYILHIHKHQKHPKGGLSCNLCKFTAKTNSSLKQHKDSIHMGNEYCCTTCEYKGASKHMLHMHRMRLHMEQYLTCSECGFKAQNINSLKAHTSENHSAIRNSNVIAQNYPSINIVAV